MEIVPEELNPSVWVENASGVVKYSNYGPVEVEYYLGDSETVQDTASGTIND